MTAPGTSTRNVSNRSLAHLARAGFYLVRQPIMRVAYEVHHVDDTPGYLQRVLAERSKAGDVPHQIQGEAQPEPFIETLTSAGYGAGLVVGTRTVTADMELLSLSGEDSQPRVVNNQVARRFDGNVLPNVNFPYDPNSVFEGLIAIGDWNTALRIHHCRAILEVVHEVARLAADVEKGPILSLQSPVQLPPDMYPAFEDDPGSVSTPVVRPRTWPRSSAVAVRFAIALAEPTTERRLNLMAALSEFCSERGFRFWVADSRSGVRAGNWFPLCGPTPAASGGGTSDASTKATSAEPAWSVPVTFVGPARVGAVLSIVEYLKAYPAVGVATCSMSIVDDITFFHVDLTVADASVGGLDKLNAAIDRAVLEQPSCDRVRAGSLEDLLPSALSGVTGAAVEPPDAGVVSELVKKVHDFQLLAGPARIVKATEGMHRPALWMSWEVEGRGEELSVPFLKLYHALEILMKGINRSNAGQLRLEKEGPNVEYLICRKVRHTILRGRAKISLPTAIEPFVRNSDLRGSLSQLCERIEQAWRATLDPEHKVRELTVSWRENWLGHWSMPLD